MRQRITQTHSGMLKSYLTVALRRFRRGGTYAVVNVAGLAIGMATCSLIFLLVYNEWSFDGFHEQQDSIHRVYLSYESPEGDPGVQAMMPPEFTPSMQATFPGILEATRLVVGGRNLEVGENTYVFQMAEVDPGFFRMFSFDVLAGDAAAAIADPTSAVLTEEMASAIFGASTGDWSSALGQFITVNAGENQYDFSVAAVIADFAPNSSISFDFAASFENYANIRLGGNNWGGRTSTYVRLRDGYSPEDLEAAAPAFAATEFAEYIEGMQGADLMAAGTDGYALLLQPLRTMHRDQSVFTPYEVNAFNPLYTYIVFGIGILILLIACINFMTLSVGQSAIRAREVGVRKVLGANRQQIMRQHWGESVVIATISLLVGVVAAVVLLPAFNSLIGTQIELGSVSFLPILAAFMGVVVVVGLVAGGYPAIVLSRFVPARVLKGSVSSPKNGLLTQSLVVLQFTISIGLIVATGIMTSQLQFMLEKDLGFDDDYIVAVNSSQIPRSEADGVRERMRDQLLPYEQITHIERAGSSFTRGSDRNGWSDANGTQRSAYNMGVGYDYLDLMGMEMVEGRFLSADFPGDEINSIVVNEALVAEFGIENPVGHILTNWLSFIYEESPTIVGVVKDFHFRSLRNEVDPMVMNMHPGYYNYMGALLVRVQPGNVQSSLTLIEDAWNVAADGRPFTYSFVDEDLATQYATEQSWQKIISYASALAILIACMGLFGLALLTVVRRTKEIGIRKVLGATVPGVTALVSREFAVLVVVASVLATPLAYFAMAAWLENFAFKVPITPWIFVGASLAALAIALGTVSLHSVRAARANPTRSLRYE
jgi:putative ABC transport system permease protein